MIIETAKQYWTVISQYNRHRENPAIGPAAIRTLRRIETTSPAILRRIAAFDPPAPPPKRA